MSTKSVVPALLVLLIAVLALTTWSHHRETSGRGVQQHRPEVHDEPLPTSCDEKLVERLVPRVLRAINDADQRQLALYFGDDMEWYSAGMAGDHRFIKAVVPTQLMDYLLQRHRHGERTELLELTVTNWSSSDVSWYMRLRIHADDLITNPMDVYAKAQASCQTHRILRWSVGSM